MLSFAAAQLALTRRPEPAALLAQVMGERGAECFPECDQKAGKCPQFCAGPGWSGSCCRAGAVGPLWVTGGGQCGDRGCVDNHCCVDDSPGDNADDADGSGSGESAEEVQRQIEETQRQLNEDAEKATAKALKEAGNGASPDLDSEVPTQPSPVGGDHRGLDCWDACGQAPGPCFDRAKGHGFCGKASEWSGSCCKLGAVGYDQSWDCMSRGCVGFHCCVEDTAADIEAAAQADATGPAAVPEPAAPDEAALPGSECWSKCDEKAGKCPQFCANPPFWMGSCCRLDATEKGESPDCTNRGCVGSHCCVADSSGSGETPEEIAQSPEEIEAQMEDTQREMNEEAEKAMAAEAKAAEKASKEAEKVEKAAEKVQDTAEKEQKEAERKNEADAEAIAPTVDAAPVLADPGLFSNHQTDQDKRSIANWTRNDLRNIYVHARPSNNLSQVGLMVHCFDGTEDWTQPWAPCLEGECVEGNEKKNFVHWYGGHSNPNPNPTPTPTPNLPLTLTLPLTLPLPQVVGVHHQPTAAPHAGDQRPHPHAAEQRDIVLVGQRLRLDVVRLQGTPNPNS